MGLILIAIETLCCVLGWFCIRKGQNMFGLKRDRSLEIGYVMRLQLVSWHSFSSGFGDNMDRVILIG